MSSLRPYVLAVLLVLTGCSGSGSDEAADVAVDETAATTTTAAPAVTSTTTTTSEESPADEESSADAPAPVEAYDEDGESQTNVETDPTTAWISRRSMSADAIEVVWSAPEGAAEYQIHRLALTERAEPDDSEMTSDNMVFEGELNGAFVDSDITADELYWYGVRGLDADGNVLSAGWHQVAAVTDEQAPAQVELTVEQDGGSVLLSWAEPAENYQMHGYRILRAVGDGEPEVVASTWDLDQTSFVDNDPPAALTTYSVVAFDFHWNDSEPAEVSIDLS